LFSHIKLVGQLILVYRLATREIVVVAVATLAFIDALATLFLVKALATLLFLLFLKFGRLHLDAQLEVALIQLNVQLLIPLVQVVVIHSALGCSVVVPVFFFIAVLQVAVLLDARQRSHK
jgi:hypothetical protein